MKTAIALRHIRFEDLGAFAAPLQAAGYAIRYIDVADFGAIGSAEAQADLVVVLGGPIGVYEELTYPFLKDEIAFIERRLANAQATLGICLGAQLIARAAGARVYPSGGKEIGFAPITLTEAGRRSCLAPFAAAPTTLHWHGDTFDLPEGARRLASTDLCENQAFELGDKVIGFQFHPEADCGAIENWLVGHAVELAAAGVDVVGLRQQAVRHRAELTQKAAAVATAWLAGIAAETSASA